MGNTCCQASVDTSTFKDYCSQTAAKEFLPFLAKLENQEIHVTGEINQNTKSIVIGDWTEGTPPTGQGIIFAPEKFYYEGPITEGSAEGVGRILWPNKTIFMGFVQGNKAEGQGEIFMDDNKVQLKGLWVNGYPKLNHKFELTMSDNKKGNIIFIDKDQKGDGEEYFKKETIQASIEYLSGMSYQGDLKRKKGGYKLEGKGNLKFPDGSYYDGDLVAGRMHGQGKYFWAKTGHWYEGEYKSNFRDGYGKYFFGDGEFQEGQWNGGTLIAASPEVEQPIPIPKQENKESKIIEDSL